MKLYEAMFLVDSSRAASDWEGVLSEIRKIVERASAEILTLKKWDERQLAYKVNGHSRGTYILCFFRAEGSRIAGIERDVQLSEPILRVLILSAEGREQDVDKQTPVEAAEKEIQQRARQAEESEKQEEPVGAPAKSGGEAEEAQASAETEEQAPGEMEAQQVSESEPAQDNDDSEKKVEGDNESAGTVENDDEQSGSEE